jgi:hypothetical protein
MSNKTYEGDEVLIDEDGNLLYFPESLETAILNKLIMEKIEGEK